MSSKTYSHIVKIVTSPKSYSVATSSTQATSRRKSRKRPTKRSPGSRKQKSTSLLSSGTMTNRLVQERLTHLDSSPSLGESLTLMMHKMWEDELRKYIVSQPIFSRILTAEKSLDDGLLEREEDSYSCIKATVVLKSTPKDLP